MSNVVPGRPRRQQQVYRRANTSMNLTSGGGFDPQTLEDPYVGCSSIVDKFIGTAAAASSGSYETNTLPSGSFMNGGSVGSPPKTSSSGGAALKDLISGKGNANRDLTYSSQHSGVGDTTVTADSLPISGTNNNNWAIQDQSVINDLTIGPARQQPKYSYLVGRTNTSKDLWRQPLSNTSYSHLNSYQPPVPMVPPPPPPPIAPPPLPIQNSQSTTYVVPPPTASSKYNSSTNYPKRSSQLYENYDLYSNNSNRPGDISFGNTSSSTSAGSKRNINTSIGTDYQVPPPPRHTQLYNQPPPPTSFSSSSNLVDTSHINISSASAALSYEDRINTALGRKVPKSSTTQTIASTQNLQKSKSYGTFASVRSDLALQV